MEEENLSKNVEQAYRVIETSIANLEKAKKLLEKLERLAKKEDYSKLPGEEGTFDGVNIVCSDGKVFEVPANYAAKSRLVYGDLLKRVDSDGKILYKQVEKVERKKIEGVMTKKEGAWYLISDSGSYRIADTAAEFNQLQVNDEVEAYIPQDNLHAPYAAFDRLITVRDETQTDGESNKKPIKKTISTGATAVKSGSNKSSESKPKSKRPTKRAPTKEKIREISISDVSDSASKDVSDKSQKETQSTIVLGEDDLR